MKKKIPEEYKTLVIEEVEYFTKLTPQYVNRKKWEKPDKNKIISVIPGTILEIMIIEGEHVEQGKECLLLEAMKMRNIVLAPATGKIKAINVAAGKIVTKGELLFEIEPDIEQVIEIETDTETDTDEDTDEEIDEETDEETESESQSQ